MPDIVSARHDNTMVLRLNRPHRRNSIGGALLGELIEAVAQADDDSEIRAVVTTGEGSTYCVGADLDTLGELSARGPIDLGGLGTDGVGGRTGLPVFPEAQRRVDHLGLGRWALRFLEIGTPTVAAINGAAAGGGFALAMLHDIRIMARTARLAPGFLTIGLSPEMGMSWLLPRIVGMSNAFDLLTRKDPIGADEALALGLVSQVVEGAELLEAALSVAARFADTPDRSVRVVKRLLRQGQDATYVDQLEREWLAQRLLFADEETREYIAHIVANVKRPHER